MCGIIGLMSKRPIIEDLLFGLTTLQHRGQTACGIVTLDDVFHCIKGLGVISQVFNNENLATLTGNVGMGHVRYATQGSSDLINAQPLTVNFPFGLAMIHNGNIVNFNEVRRSLYEENHVLIETTNDLELLLNSFAAELMQKDLNTIGAQDLFDAVTAIQNKLLGGYAVITTIAKHGLLAFVDPNGLRPLILGKKETDDGFIYGFASESSTFDYLGYEVVDSLKPGEAVFVDFENNLHRQICVSKKRSFCVFEWIYFSREDSFVQDRLVADERMKMGRLLAKKINELGLEPDIVIDIPTSAYFFANALAEELHVPYRRGLAKNNHIGRSFILSTQKERETTARLKLNPIRGIVQGKKVAIVDDSIVRGTTSKHIVSLLRKAGAKEIYFVSAAPPIMHQCLYGIDMAIKDELIGRKPLQEIQEYLGVDALVYQSLDDLKSLYQDEGLCYACFDGIYPVEDSGSFLNEIEKERKRNC